MGLLQWDVLYFNKSLAGDYLFFLCKSERRTFARSLEKNVPEQMAQDAVRSASEPVASIKFDIHSHQHSLETISKKGGRRGAVWNGLALLQLRGLGAPFVDA